jgi:hypothetical protein
VRTRLWQDAEEATMTAGTRGLEQGYLPHVHTVMSMLAPPWKVIPATSIEHVNNFWF